ncbi:hypothetical protein [Natronolimnohabitans innermongolicus]|uniref:Uncharacterized protein n=1 Tax=Natronolimnohabitans innermongolicus JCM 12255 TaxID=1227499 RepID=L9WRL2_9EURY|nr:hypothetical protein [Natronolimnohabitans innermongolicus]ELY52037.1 hypothetical protein C493_16791 [Natronolimnohabitans innermongolicus JCM 12255]
MSRLTRRQLLCGASLSALVGGLSITAWKRRFDSTADAESDGRAGFAPATDGFGFDNFSTPPVVPDPVEFVDRSELRTRLLSDWDGPLGMASGISMTGSLERRVRSIADELYGNATRLFGTEGYCYGMAATAQQYFEEPDSMPVDRESASEIEHVNEPLEDGDSRPVREDIERLHRRQFTEIDSWLNRWPLLRPGWIDYQAQERELRDALDDYGSAGLTITGDDVLRGHYVLAYDYDVDDTGVTFAVYDPNDSADEYAGSNDGHTVGVETTGSSYEPRMDAYEGTYDRFLFTSTDRTIRADVVSA